MKNKKRMVHVKIIDGNEKHVKVMSMALGKLTETMPEYEFIVTNENVELRDVKHLIWELWKLYRAQKELKNGEVKK